MALDLRSANIPFQSENNSSSRPPFVAVIAGMEQAAWGHVPREGLSNLLCRLIRGWMGGDIEMNHAAPMMGQNHKDKENSKVHGRYHEEIRGDQLLQVTVEERMPRLGVWFSGTLHALGDGGLR